MKKIAFSVCWHSKELKTGTKQNILLGGTKSLKLDV
jgi:hypothetical protein